MSSWDDDVEMAEASDEEDEEDEVAGALEGCEYAIVSFQCIPSHCGVASSESEDDEDDIPPASRLSAFNDDGDRNSHLTVGYKGDRTYVVRGTKIGVFNTAEHDQMNFMGNIKGARTAKGKEFKPKDVCSLKFHVLSDT